MAVSARLLAYFALWEFCFTVDVNCSMLAAVSCSDAACSSVREDRSVLPAAIPLLALYEGSIIAVAIVEKKAASAKAAAAAPAETPPPEGNPAE